jgi:CheY-like chemotaxis protein
MSDTPKLLLVDDDGDLRALLKEALKYTWDITEAGTLADAKASAEENNPDAILLDLNLPCSKGPATYFTMQMLCPNIPIIVFTGYEEQADLMRSGLKSDHIIIKGTSSLREIARTILTAIKELQVYHEFANYRSKIDDSAIAVQELKTLNLEKPIAKVWERETPPKA